MSRTKGSRSRPPTTSPLLEQRPRSQSCGARLNRARCSVTVEDATGLPADNERFAALGSRGRPKALVIADGAALYLSRALGASNGEEVEVVPAARVATLTVEQLASYRRCVLLSTRGLERPARERLMSSVKNGGGLFIAAARELEPGGPGWDDRLGACPGGDRAGRAAHALRDRNAPSNLPALRRARRQPRSSAFGIAPGECGLTAGQSWPVSRMARRRSSSARPAAAASCSSLPTLTAVERLPTAPGVRAVRSREPALRGGGPPPAPGLHRGPGAGRGLARCRAFTDRGPSAVCGQRGCPGGCARPDGIGRTSRVWSGTRARPPSRPLRSRRSKPSQAELLAVWPGPHDCYTGCRIGGRARVTVHDQLRSLLSSVHRRWRAEVSLRAVGRGSALAAGPFLLAGAGLTALFAPGRSSAHGSGADH